MLTPTLRISENKQAYAIIAVILGAGVFSFGDAVIKFVSLKMVLWQILTLRSAIIIPVLILLCYFGKTIIPIQPKRKGWTLVRSMLMVLMWLTYYGALIYLPVTVAASVYYTMPLFLALFSAALIGEKVSKGGWIAVVLGFLGVLIVIQPDQNEFNLFSLLPLASAIFFALAMIITRKILQSEHPLALTLNLQYSFFITGLIGTVVASLFDVQDVSNEVSFFTNSWKMLGSFEWLVVVVLAIIIAVGNILTSIAYQNGQPAMIGTLSFSYIPFLGVWGFLFFNEVPSLTTITGVILVIIAGYITMRS